MESTLDGSNRATMAERKVAVRGGRSKEDPVAGLMRKGMSWLGLGPDEDYADDYEYYDDDQDMVDLTEDVDAPAPAPRRAASSCGHAGERSELGSR